MTLEDIPFAWLLFALIAYGLVTACAATLASRLRGAKTRHDLVLQSRLRRLEYYATLEGRDGHGDVEVVEDAAAPRPARPEP